ncbi:Rap1a/Tai family immunity protein [Pseudomonas oryzihabitans]|uniref:Rap1a/Tai family immunity protein n=1 Tax=Pseudomonas oryzihabitans TaxID=47885 RepID=UPI0039176624
MAFSAASHAFTGTEITAWAVNAQKEPRGSDAMALSAYVAAVVDGRNNVDFCLPSHATYQDAINLVKPFAMDWPVYATGSGAWLVTNAIRTKYPCN